MCSRDATCIPFFCSSFGCHWFQRPFTWDSRLPIASPDVCRANRQGAGSGTRSGWVPSVVRPPHLLPR